jgi:hypothetical protein
VDDPRLVQGGERVGELSAEPRRPLGGHRRLPVQTLTRHVLHHEPVRVPWRFHDVEQGHDVGMVPELGQGTRLTEQPSESSLAVALDPLRFERDVLAHHGVVCQPHIAAPPRADDLLQDVTADELVSATHGSPSPEIQTAQAG